MEPTVIAGLYAAETAVEGTVAGAIAVAKPTMPLKVTFKRVRIDTHLPRSSHSLSVINEQAYLWGGETQARLPVDNDMHIFTLPSSGVEEADYKCVPAKSLSFDEEIPAPRVGHTAATISGRIYVFGGRGGPDMKPLAERGRVWCFDTMSSGWSFLDPVHGSPYPAARSYHAAAATEHPLPSRDDHTSNPVGSPNLDAHGTIFVHGGCPASGRMSDIWAFDVAACTWSQFPDAPGSPRGGPCLSYLHNRLYRFGGFDGKNELGGQIDFLDIVPHTLNDKTGSSELCMSPRTGKWETVSYPHDARAPGNRSVAGFQPITTGQGRNYLLLFLGDRDSSSKGHEGAGKFWSDVWSYQLRSESNTGASFKDATRRLIGVESSEETWAEAQALAPTASDGRIDHPGERGWFASASNKDLDASSVVFYGGINESNERLADLWILTVDS